MPDVVGTAPPAQDPPLSKDERKLARALMRAATSLAVERQQFGRKAGLTYRGSDGVYKRDLYFSCGYLDKLGPADYRARYERGGVAERIVEAAPRGTWVGGIEVREHREELPPAPAATAILPGKPPEPPPPPGTEEPKAKPKAAAAPPVPTQATPPSRPPGADPEAADKAEEQQRKDAEKRAREIEDTEFEKSVNELFTRLGAWERLLRADILAGLGRYGILVIGAAGGSDMERELKSVSKAEDILFLTPLGEDRATISKLVTEPSDERFGLPEFYECRFGTDAASKSARVHPSRVLHVAEGLLDDEVYGKPRLRACFNLLDDLDKIVAGGAEATWRNADPGLQVDVDPEAELDTTAVNNLKNMVDEYVHDLRRVLQTQGTKVTRLSGSVPSFGPNADAVLQLIAGTCLMPKRILVGSERGELSSTQDESNWDDRLRERRREFATPLARKLIERFIELGALPKPKDPDYEIAWPEDEGFTELERAQIAAAIAAANAAQKTAEGQIILTSEESRKRLYGLDPLPPPPAPVFAPPAVAGNSTEPTNSDAAKPAPPFGQKVNAPADAAVPKAAAALAAAEPPLSPRVEAETRSVDQAADNGVPILQGAMRNVWLSASLRVDEPRLTELLAAREGAAAGALVADALTAAEAEHEDKIAYALRRPYRASAEKAAEHMMRRALRAAADAKQKKIPDLTDPRRARFEQKNPIAVAWAKAAAAKLLTEVDDSTIEAVREVIALGLAEGIAPAKLARTLREIIGLRSDQIRRVEALRAEGASEKELVRFARQLLNERALLVARTETMRAAVSGQIEAWRQAQERGFLPPDQEMRWIGTDDNRIRPEHLAMYKLGVTAKIGESFPKLDANGNETGEYILPGEEPNCRCKPVLVDPLDLEGRLAETESA